MQLVFYIDHKHNVIMQMFTGNITISSVTHSLPIIWNHPDYASNFNSIVDFRNAKLMFSKAELNDLLKTLDNEERALQGRIAIMVSDPSSAATATIFADETKDFQGVGVFCTEFEVIRFLKSSPEVFEKPSDVETVTVELP